MSKFAQLDAELKARIAATTILKAKIGTGLKWSFGLPPGAGSAQGYTVIRVDALENQFDKQGQYVANINLWAHNTDPLPFLDMAEELQASLAKSKMIAADGYLYRPEPANNLQRALFRVSIYLTE